MTEGNTSHDGTSLIYCLHSMKLVSVRQHTGIPFSTPSSCTNALSTLDIAEIAPAHTVTTRFTASDSVTYDSSTQCIATALATKKLLEPEIF